MGVSKAENLDIVQSGYFQEEREKKSNEWSTSAIEMAGKGNGRDPRKDLELKK